MDWIYEYEERVTEHVEQEIINDLIYDFLSPEVSDSWYDIEKVEKAALKIDQRLDRMVKESLSIDDSAEASTIEWYKDNEDMTDEEEIRNLPDFNDMVDSDRQLMWDYFNEEYKDYIDILNVEDDYALRQKILNVQDDMTGIVDKIKDEIIPNTQEEIIKEMFNGLD